MTLPKASALVDATRVPVVVAFGAMLPQPDMTRARTQTAATAKAARALEYL